MNPGKWLVTWGIITFVSSPLWAAEQVDSLPEPFTLEDALAYADRVHPDLTISESNVKQAEAGVLQADASDDLDIRLRAEAQWIEPAELSPYQDSDDHRLSLLLDKPLYDFGLQAA